MLAGPVTPLRIVSGEAAGYYLAALIQSVIIVGAGALLFDVNWGDPVAAISLVLVWAAVGTGAGMLSGALFRTPEQATSVGVTIGIVFAMLGGAMWPLEIVGPVMQAVGHVVPHGWAVDGWIEVMARRRRRRRHRHRTAGAAGLRRAVRARGIDPTAKAHARLNGLRRGSILPVVTVVATSPFVF